MIGGGSEACDGRLNEGGMWLGQEDVEVGL